MVQISNDKVKELSNNNTDQQLKSHRYTVTVNQDPFNRNLNHNHRKNNLLELTESASA
jgi:hypothetical protein